MEKSLKKIIEQKLNKDKYFNSIKNSNDLNVLENKIIKCEIQNCKEKHIFNKYINKEIKTEYYKFCIGCFNNFNVFINKKCNHNNLCKGCFIEFNSYVKK